MPKLIVLVGLPGSGKTTWRNDYLDNIVSTRPMVLSQDDLVEEYAAEHGINYAEAFKRADLKVFERQVKSDFIQGIADNQTIVLDRTNLTAKGRKGFLSLLPSHYDTIAVVFHMDPLVLEDRLERRAAETGKLIPDYVIRQMRKSYQAPTLTEFQFVISVNSPPPGIRLRVRGVWRAFKRRIAKAIKR